MALVEGTPRAPRHGSPVLTGWLWEEGRLALEAGNWTKVGEVPGVSPQPRSPTGVTQPGPQGWGGGILCYVSKFHLFKMSIFCEYFIMQLIDSFSHGNV